MDERQFQQELNNLKQRITSLSLPSSPKMSAEDAFTRQLAPLKGILSMMQERLTGLEASVDRQACLPKQKPSLPVEFSSPDGHALSQIRTRVAALEAGLLDIEDKLDRFDPNRFTPPTSTTGSEGAVVIDASTPCCYYPPDPFVRQVPELHSDATANLGKDIMSDFRPRASNLSLSTEKQLCPNNSTWMAAPAMQPSDPIADPNPTPPFGFQGRDTRWSTGITPQMSAYRARIKNPDWFSRRALERQNSHMQAREGEHMPTNLPNLQDGLAFRDREIARLDEQLRIAQERLRESEESRSADCVTISRLRDELDQAMCLSRGWTNGNGSVQTDMLGYRDRIDEQEREIQGLRLQVSEHVHRLRDWEADSTQLQDSLRLARARAKASNRQVREREQRDAEVERTLLDNEEQIERLRGIVEEKGDVIKEQEHLISQGKKVLEEKDGEIEELQRRIRHFESHDNRLYSDDALRTSYRTDAGWSPGNDHMGAQDRDYQPKGAKLGGVDGKRIAPDWNSVMRNFKPATDDVGPFERYAKMYMGHWGASPALDTASKVRNERGYTEPGQSTASAISFTAGHPKRRYPASSRELRNSLPSRSPPYSDTPEEEVRVPSGQRRRMLSPRFSQGDDIPYRPKSVESADSLSEVSWNNGVEQGGWHTLQPLPIVGPRLASESGLRAMPTFSNTFPPRKTLARRDSTQGLRRRRLQAYVESDQETSGEFGGEV